MSDNDLDLDIPMGKELDVDRIRVSPSKIRCFMEDQAQYYFRYIEGRRSTPSPALFEGTAYHRGIEYALERKRESEDGKLPPLPDTLEFLRTFWNKEHPDSINGSVLDQERLIYVSGVFEILYPVLETITPKMLEAYVLTPVDEYGYDLQGFIDCVHTKAPGPNEFDPEQDTIIDFKSKGQSPGVIFGKPTMGNFDELQLTLYGWALTKGEAPINGEIIYIVKNRAPKIVRVPKVITTDQMKSSIETVTRIVEAIETGRFIPNYGHWMCRPDRCEFWAECHKKF